MKRFINYLRGAVVVTATGMFPERLINLCAQERVEFWGVEWPDEHAVCMVVRRRDVAILMELAQRVNCEVCLGERWGLPDFLLRFQRRYAFLIGLTLSLCAVTFLSRFVLAIDVTGNQRVSTAVILNGLRQVGVYPGVYGPSLDREQAAQEALLILEELSWMNINLYGTRLEVIVRERVLPPERVDESGYYHIAAEADGVVTHLEAELGEAVVQEGDTVKKGDILISGIVTIQPPLYSELPVRTYQTHARGRVWARTWRTMEAVIPLSVMGKGYTGEESVQWTLDVFGHRIEIFRNSSISWEFYDKIISTYQGRLYGDVKMPLFLVREHIREYQPMDCPINRDAAQKVLEEALYGRLQVLLGEDGRIYSSNYSARVEDNCLRVTLLAECREEIGQEIPGETDSATE